MSGFQDLNIKPLIDKYQLVNFVETGCYTGDGIAHAFRNGLEQVYSCDINPSYVRMCRAKFPNASIHTLHSVAFLDLVCDVIPGHCLFWLDAHFPELYGQQSNTQEEYFPLFKELETISKKPDVEKDVIIVDDIRVIISNDNPIKQDFDEQYKIRGTTLKQLVDLFPNHNHELVDFQEGVLFFTPKG